MTKKNLYIAWAIMYALCAALGFVPAPEGALYGLLFMLSLAFFIPPAVLLYQAVQRSDLATVRLVRALSMASLIATLVALVLNLLSVGGTVEAGRFAYYLLILVSSPMVCNQAWFPSLFLWACLLVTSWQELRKHKKRK